jgi:hypothetical protein
MFHFEKQESIIRFVLDASEEDNERLAAFAAGVRAARRWPAGKKPAGPGARGNRRSRGGR